MSKTFAPLASLAFLLSLALLSATAQTATNAVVANPQAGKDQPPKSDEKAEQIIKRAIEAMGGGAYLAVRTIVSTGNYTPYDQGISGSPMTFVDYLALPDRERTEFKGRGVRSIQTYTGDTGWIFDGMVRKINDLTPEQIEDFRLEMRASLDNLLRGWWRSEGAQLSYLGRREAGLGNRNEALRLTYPDGFAVEYELRARDFLLTKIRYKKRNKDGDDIEEELRYAQHLTIAGVVVPFVRDHYRAGQQFSRVNYEKVDLNAPIPESLFTRPADVKSVK